MLLMHPASSRILLVPDGQRASAGPHAAKVRRYRMARMRLAQRRGELPARAMHLIKAYD